MQAVNSIANTQANVYTWQECLDELEENSPSLIGLGGGIVLDLFSFLFCPTAQKESIQNAILYGQPLDDDEKEEVSRRKLFD